MKTRLLIGCLLAILAGFAAGAQQSNDMNNHSLLWRISGNGLKKPSYLFGTIHIICPGDYLWTAKMKESLANSDKVCFEMNLGDTSLTRQLMAAMKNKDGKKLEDYFTPEDFTIVYRYFNDSLDINISKLQQMNPVVLQSLLLKKIVNCAKPVNYEKRILQTAAKDDKEITGLETAEDQMELLKTIPPDKIVKALVAVANGNRRMYDVYNTMVNAYKIQDLPFLYKMMEQYQTINAMDAFLDERNKKWIDLMPDEMKHKSVFFAVGAMHLLGDNGLIHLLRLKGYTVEPLIDTINLSLPSSEKVSSEKDHMPKPGYDFGKYMSDNLVYPVAARKKNITGRVIIKFVVNEDGTISDCKVVSSIDRACDKEALRVIENMPAWIPGIRDGKPVKVYFTQPVTFALNDGKN